MLKQNITAVSSALYRETVVFDKLKIGNTMHICRSNPISRAPRVRFEKELQIFPK
jgi:hypothetical protein